MKKIFFTTALTLSSIYFAGCGSTTLPPPTLSNRAETFKELPSWMHSNKNPYIATGSAPFREQDFSMQRDEAIIIAKANLVESLEQKIDSLKKLHKATQVGAYKDTKIELTTKQVSSRLLSGTILTNTYMANNGEMFVQIMLDPKFALGESEKLFIASELRSDEAFKELSLEVEKFEEWKK